MNPKEVKRHFLPYFGLEFLPSKEMSFPKTFEKVDSGIILIVDDTRECREIIRLGLEDRGFSCLEAENGKSALQIVRNGLISFIITDFQMPLMNGCEFLEQLALENPHPPPALMITGNFTKTICDRALRAGAIRVLSKPFDQKDLFTYVELSVKGQFPDLH